MKKFQIVKLVAIATAASFLFAANVQAGALPTAGFTTDRTEYLGGVHGTDWIFTGISGPTSGNGWANWMFSAECADGSTQTATLRSHGYNGNSGVGTASVNTEIGTASMQHNSANTFTLTFMDKFVDSFFIALEPHSSFSAATAFNLTIAYWVGDTLRTMDTLNARFTENTPFLGIILDEGAYLHSVTFASSGTPNNGYRIRGMGFGDNGFDVIYPDVTPPAPPTAEVPAPATLAVMLLGLGALPLARRFRKNK